MFQLSLSFSRVFFKIYMILIFNNFLPLLVLGALNYQLFCTTLIVIVNFLSNLEVLTEENQTIYSRMNKKKYYNNSGLCRQCHFSGNLFLNPQHSFRVFLTFGRTVRLFSHSLITRFLISYIGTNNRRVKEGKNIFRQNKLSIYLVIMKNPVVTDLFFQYITKSFHNFQLLLLVHFLTSWSEHIMNNIPGCKNNEHYLEVLQLYRAFLFCFFTDALF